MPEPRCSRFERLREQLSQRRRRRARVGADVQHAVVAHQREADCLAGEQPLAALQDDVEHRLGVGDRAADRRKNFARRALLVERLLRLVEQPHVLDRDHRLVAERAQQRDLALGERPHLVAAHQDDAEAPCLRGTAA